MTVPPDEGRDEAEPPLDFDPYRFGKPDHPIAPEYAPPGYRPPADAPAPPNQPYQPGPPGPPPYGTPPYGPPQSGQQYGSPQYGPPGYGSPQYGPPYGQPQYGPPGYPPHYQQGAAQTGNTKATVALVLGVLSLVFCWTTVLDLVLIVPAIVLGIIGRKNANRPPGRDGSGKATSGIICAVLALVLAVTAGIYTYGKIKPCLDKYSATSQSYKQCVHDRIGI